MTKLTGVRYKVATISVFLAVVTPSVVTAYPDPTSAAMQRWASRYSGPGNAEDYAQAIAVNPAGTRVFVTGASTDISGGCRDFATIAYSSGTGPQLWAARYNNGCSDEANAIAVSPDGTRVYVTGGSTSKNYGPDTPRDYATVAYSATTGAQLWVARYNGPSNAGDTASALVVSPDGTKVYVTGSSSGGNAASGGTGTDYATVAYDAATGNQLWVMRYNAPDNGHDSAYLLSISPNGSTVFVGGGSQGRYGTVAYNAANGTQLWFADYNSPTGWSFMHGMVISPVGGQLYVTGETSYFGSGIPSDYATVAYNTSTGTQIWSASYGSSNKWDSASSLAVSPNGDRLYVTGRAGVGDAEYATLSYDTVSGTLQWVSRLGNGGAADIVVSPDGSIFVTGTGYFGLPTHLVDDQDYLTAAYDKNGNLRWVQHYEGTQTGGDYATAMALRPDGGRVFVTGYSEGRWFDYATVSYCTLPAPQSATCLAGM